MSAARTVTQTEELYAQLAGVAAMKIVEAVLAQEQWALDALAEYRATGNAPILKLQSLEKVADV